MTTETVAPAATTDEATAEQERAAKVAKVNAALDDFGRMAVERLIGQVTARNADVDRLNSVGGDRITRLDTMRDELSKGEGSYDAGLVTLVKQIATLEDKV